MQTLYLDIFSGISGDMFLGALLDLGMDFKTFERELRKLKLDGYHLHADRRQKSGIEGVKFDVHLTDGHTVECGQGLSEMSREHAHSDSHAHEHGPERAHSLAESDHLDASTLGSKESPSHDHDHAHGSESRNFEAIQALISASALSAWVKEKSFAVFQRIAVAEGKIHGVPPGKVQFHEVGAVDSIVDIVGGCIALELLGKPRVWSAPVVEGTGFVKCAHGQFPIPTAATLEILGAKQIAVTQCEEPHELVTPTGAALLAEFVEHFGRMDGLVAHRVGYGLGTRNNQTRPNVLRAVLTRDAGVPATTHDWQTDTVVVLETNLDDIPAELLGHVLEKAFRLGALDVFHTPIQMKKNRPGVLLTVLCDPADADRFTELLLVETSSFGVRRSIAERRKLQREFVEVKTAFGTVRIKLGRLDGRVVQVAPEFDSIRDIAAQAGVPAKSVFEAARTAAAVYGS
ncbi:MAG: nickel pincer cofactor biosynthesis protein LarC [Pedosphaera sp.]|nr:nickel pincer cofactor biosynthesis protein LarC [Pedosphaera sp.]